MPTTEELLEAYASRIEAVILEEPDPQAAMAEIALVAERRGLVHSAANLRRESPWAFVMDLWLENPLIYDLINLNRLTFRGPEDVQDLVDVLDLLP